MPEKLLSQWMVLSISLVFTPGIQAVATTDFSCAFPISQGQQSIRTFTLTENVYKCLKYPRAQDLVIINRDNQLIPYRLFTPGIRENATSYTTHLTYYPEPETTAYKTGDQIKRIAALTGIASGNESDTQWLEKNTYYASFIVELNRSDDQLKSITINRKSLKAPVSAMVMLEASDDLKHWTTLLTPLNILYLPGNNRALQSNILNIEGRTSAHYLRLAILSNVQNFTNDIAGISADYVKTTLTPTPLIWSQPGALQPLQSKNEWRLPLTDLLPVSRIRFTQAENIVFYQGSIYVQPPVNPDSRTQANQDNRDAKAKIRSLIKNTIHDPHVPRQTPVDPWQYLAAFTQYKINTGNGSIASSAIHITPTQSRDWKIIFQQPDITSSSQLPVVEVGWTPSQIIFIAQGPGPYTVLAGNDTAPTTPDIPRQLLSLEDAAEQVELVDARSPEHSPAKPISEAELNPYWQYRNALLWLVLSLGVIVMGVMAYRLSRKMKLDDKP